MRLMKVNVTLVFEMPADTELTDAWGCDAANETLRELQKRFNPVSDLVDYGVGDRMVAYLDIDAADYEEDNHIGAVDAPEELK